ncbi:MAG: hypothetical protein RLZZ491_2390, partial [Pseudomonadota bacterium]
MSIRSYTFVGAAASERAGFSVSSAGDVDGDGLDDLIIGAHYAEGGAFRSGESYLVLSADLAAIDAADGLSDGVVDLALVAGVGGSYRFEGVGSWDLAGQSVASAGDIDNDGLADLIIAARLADGGGADSGETYLIRAADLAAADAADGTTDGVINLGLVGGTGGSYRFVGAEGDSGHSVTSAGDVDGDGLDDVMVGRINTDVNGTNTGSATLILAADLVAADAADGTTDGTIELDRLGAIGGSYLFHGRAPEDQTGNAIAAGDADGDGKDDVLIGAPTADFTGLNNGRVYLVTSADLTAADAADGTVDGGINLRDVAGIGGSYEFRGNAALDGAGNSVAFVGDLDGDGKEDILIGAWQADPNGKADAGISYLILAADLAAIDAQDGVQDGVILLGQVAGTGGSYQFNGALAGDRSGFSVASAGDVDGDGVADLIIGARFADGGGLTSGETYLVLDKDLAALDAADGTTDGVIDLGLVAGVGGSYQFVGAAAGD